jgi:cysteine desulfurase/selenocysteine lyase
MVKKKNILDLRNDFPTLKRKINGSSLIYFDNGATSQKPNLVIDRITSYYQNENSNIHRGVHKLSQEATLAYENARKKIQSYINAQLEEEIIFTKGTTDSINLVANGFSRKFLNLGDEIIISAMEHHSNIVPWQLACEYSGANLKVCPVDDQGDLDIEVFKSLISKKTKLVAITHVSNTLGTINPVKEIVEISHTFDIPVLLDGAQSVPHMKVDMQELDCEFYAFGGHKMFGPTGTGVLYGKKDWLEKLPPYQGGGDMIKAVTFEKTTYNDLPHKFEAGTPNISGVIGLGAAVDYLSEIDWEALHEHESDLLDYATFQINQIEGIRIIGTSKNKVGVLSFVHEKAHHYDIGTILDQLGIAIRTGHHCTEPLMHIFKVSGTARASFAFYNTKEEVDVFIAALKRALKMIL